MPLCEHNYNLVELGPRGTGKSYAYQELSPYTILLTGPTTVANLFYNMASGKMGLVGIWDAIGFDEVADLQKMPKEVVTTLKTYCESGTFARGKESMSGMASLAMFGNTNQPVEVMVRSSHLFTPMPDVIREDMAFLDRIHYYIPGWEIPKMRVEFFTDHYGFVVDYLAEALRELRRHNFTEVIDRHFSLGSHLNARDVKAVRKTVSGLIKLLHPHGEFTKEELAEIVELALEGRRRVKEQLKKMGSFEYHQTSFSYIDNESREERFVGVPEQGGKDMISTDPLAPAPLHGLGGQPREGRAVPNRGWLFAWHGQVEDRGRRGRLDEGVHPAGLCLHDGPEGQNGHRPADRHDGFPRRSHRLVEQPCSLRGGDGLGRGRLFGDQEAVGRWRAW